MLVRLADRADASGVCYPGQTSLAEDCCLTPRTVRDALSALVKAGHLHVLVPATFSRPAKYLVTPLPPEGASAVEQDDRGEGASAPSGTTLRSPPENGSGPLRKELPPNPQLTPNEPTENPHGEFSLGSEVENSAPEKGLIAYLNEKAGRQFRTTEGNLKLARDRLDEVGGDVDGVKVMIDRMVARWGPDPKMSEFLQPQTLFRKEKFHTYYDNRLLPVLPAAPPPRAPRARNFDPSNTQTADV